MNKFDEYYQKRGDYHVRAYENNADFRNYIDSIVEFFDDKIGQSILNVGAGDGLEAELLLKRGHVVDLLDISSEAKRLFIQRMSNNYDCIYYDMDFLNCRFQVDWILIPNTLNWMDDETELKAVAKIKELANIGAYITVTDIAREPGMDMRSYTKERLLELFPGAGIYLQDSVRWVVIWRKK